MPSTALFVPNRCLPCNRTLKCSANSKMTVWKPTPSIIITLHITVLWQLTIFESLGAPSFLVAFLDGRLTEPQRWLSRPGLWNKLLVSRWFSLSASPHGASLRRGETSASDPNATVRARPNTAPLQRIIQLIVFRGLRQHAGFSAPSVFSQIAVFSGPCFFSSSSHSFPSERGKK